MTIHHTKFQSVRNHIYNQLIGRSQDDLQRDILWPIRRSPWIWPEFRIDGCKTFNHRNLIEMKVPKFLDVSMQEYKEKILKKVNNSLRNSEPISIIRLGDGEAFFLRGEMKGNIVKRHVTSGRSNEKDLDIWEKKYNNNNIKTFDTNWSLRRHWLPIEGKSIKNEYVPLSPIYALVSTRDIFNISGKFSMGLIGPKEKLDIIKELMSYRKFSEYLGIKQFDEYLTVPQTGAANNPDSVLEDVIQQSNKRCDIYLVGMGIAKLRLLSVLRDELEATMIDIGSGLDAIAGIIPKDRPYFGKWRNYKITGFNYHGVDILTQYMPDEKLNTFGLNSDVYLG